MTKHTPGPWRVKPFDPNECALGDGQYVQTQDGLHVAYAGQSKEDARLIAAAPDLLDALKETTEAAALACRMLMDAGLANDFIDAGHNLGIEDGFGVRANAAIAKAEQS